MDFSLKRIFKFYEKSYSPMLNNKELNEQYREAKSLALKVYNKSHTGMDELVHITLGLQKNDPNMSRIYLPQRFLNVKDPTELGKDQLLLLGEIIENCLYLGFVYHFIYMTYPTRSNISSVDFKELHNNWLPDIMVADIKMKSYNKKSDGLPDIKFESFYKQNNYESIFKERFKVGYIKLFKIHSLLRNIFYCGIMYAVFYDLATNPDKK